MRPAAFASLLLFCAAPAIAQDRTPRPAAADAPGIAVPDWALPDSPTHHQVAPPPDFHRDAVTFNTPIGRFDNQTDIGGPLVPGSARYDPAAKTYAITSAGYNIWYTRDEFRYLWKKMAGDVSLAASVSWPDPDGFGDRKVALVLRESLNDDAREIVVAQHGAGMVHLAQRAVADTRMTDMEYRVGSRGGLPGGKTPDSLVVPQPARIGIEKHGDMVQLYVSWQGETLQPVGAPQRFHFDGPFYVGVGVVSHQPAATTTATLSNVVLENRAGRVR